MKRKVPEKNPEVREIAGAIPNLTDVVNKATDAGLQEVNNMNIEPEKKEVLKHEVIRDVALSITAKLQKMWELVNLPTADEATLRKYGSYFIKPAKEVLEIARKANADIYEMKYGRTLNINKKKETLGDWLTAEATDVTDVPIVEEKKVEDEASNT